MKNIWQPQLENDLVHLTPLQEKNASALFEAASDPLIWEQHSDKTRCTPEGFKSFFQQSMDSKGALLIREKATNEVIGTSRFQILEGTDDKIEIGWTFFRRKCWGGPYNRAVKNLMIDHAFEHIDSVIFYVYEKNFRSQKAVGKLGAIRVLDHQTINTPFKGADKWIYQLTKNFWKK